MATTRVILNHQSWLGEKMNIRSNSSTKAIQNSMDDGLALCDSIQKLARKELREDKNSREQGLQQLRDWLKKTQDVRNVRQDDRFLLRFLRSKKFSVPLAEQLLLKYLNLRKAFPQMTGNLDCLDATMNEIFSSGYLFVSPVKDLNGRRVIIARAGGFNTSLFTSAIMAKAHFIAFETLLEDPESQVLGFTHIGDFDGISTSHVTLWNPNEFAKILKWGEQSVPARHKAIHCVNVPVTVKFIFDFAKTRVSNKIKDRIFIHSTLDELHKNVGRDCFPKELGGTIPMADMIDMWKKEMLTKREALLQLDDMALLSDRGIITKHGGKNVSALQAHVDSVAGSFRKLEVD